MFVEKLKLEDVKYFVENYFDSYEVGNCVKGSNFVQFELASQDTDSTLKFIATDFACKGANIMAKCGEDIATKKWNEYLTDKFGKEYKTEKMNYVRSIRNNGISK